MGYGKFRVIAAYAGMCAIWGTTWLAIKVSLRYVPPFVGVGLRFVLAGLVMYAAAAAMGQLRPARELPWKLVAALSVFFFGLNYILTYTAETRLDSGLVAVLFGTLPFFVFAFAHVYAKERTTPRIWFGACLAFAGVAAISLAGRVHGSLLFALAAIGAAASSAFGSVYAKRHAHGSPMLTLPPAMLASGVVVGGIGLATERVSWAHAIAAPSLVALVYMAILGSCVAFFLNLWLLQQIPAWTVGLSSLVIPVIAVIVGIALGGETFTWRELLGSALVIGGMWIALTNRS